MNNTPQSNRLHVGIFGKTNVGKSTLFNSITETDTAIVSDIPGTTTDPVQKAMELVPFGPIVLIDTAGLNDDTSLGRKRTEKTDKLLKRVDFAIYVIEAGDENKNEYEEFAKMGIPHLKVVTKGHTKPDIEALKNSLSHELCKIKKDSETLLGDLLAPGSTVLMVVPLDSEAPKGRLILPQAQLIRDCLDNSFMAYVSTEKELETALANIKKVDLVVTDSQIFGPVSEKVPENILLTSFSILMARQKGGIETLLKGLDIINRLKDHDKILVSEVCTHNHTHEDIGRVKIPAALRKLTGKKLDFDFTAGRDYPEDLSRYALIIHCGACMITPREMKNRILAANKAKVPITNYGLFLAFASGILKRSIEVTNPSVKERRS